MKFRTPAAAVLVSALFAVAADPVKSGLQPGEKIPGPFNPLVVTGDDAGTKRCLVCRHGTSPVVMVFAREADPAVGKLLKKVEEAVARHRGGTPGAFAVFLGDAEALEPKARSLADREKLKHVTLTVDAAPGPRGYKLAADADVTVVLYAEFTVKANHAFRKGELDDRAVERVLADVAKILPEKK